MSPLVLCFVLGAMSVALRGGLRIPEQAFDLLGIYLMLAIGLHGGKAMAEADLSSFIPVAAMAVISSMLIPLVCSWVLGIVSTLSVTDRIAVGAHYGSVSAVTFAAASSYVMSVGGDPDGWTVALLAIMEAPAILVAIFAYRMGTKGLVPITHVLGEVIGGKSVLLLVGGMVIGAMSTQSGYDRIAPLFDGLYYGILCLFLLELGSLAALRLGDARSSGTVMVLFSLIWPLFSGTIAVFGGSLLIANPATLAIFGTLIASASYIAAPAAVRMAMPEASPGIYLTMSLALTFPFNLVIGIPFYHMLSTLMVGS